MAEKVVSEARIENGPGPQSFVDGLLRMGVNGEGTTLILEGCNTVTVHLTQIQREDGSGKSFNFWGFDASTHKQVRGYYNAARGKGHIMFLS